jgi:hypothetical protein
LSGDCTKNSFCVFFRIYDMGTLTFRGLLLWQGQDDNVLITMQSDLSFRVRLPFPSRSH